MLLYHRKVCKGIIIARLMLWDRLSLQRFWYLQRSKLPDLPPNTHTLWNHKIYFLPLLSFPSHRLITQATRYRSHHSQTGGLWETAGTGAYPPLSGALVDQSRKKEEIWRQWEAMWLCLHEPFLGRPYPGRVSWFQGSKCCLCSLFHGLQQPPPLWSEQRDGPE